MRPFTYVRARSVEDAIRAMTAAGPGGRFMAGGTTLYDLMKLNVETPTRVIDVNGLKELSVFDTAGPDELIFGALARMSDVSVDPNLVRDYPALSESLWRAASQPRNMASAGGDLLQRTPCVYFRGGEPYGCNKRKPGSGCAAQEQPDHRHALLGGSPSCIAVYAGDWAVALVAFDAKVDVLGPKGPRTIALEQFYRAPGDTPHIETVLEPEELIIRIRAPKTPLGRGSTYLQIRDEQSYFFALATAAVALTMDGDRVRDARIAIGGLVTRPWRARAAEEGLTGERLTAQSARAAGDAALAGAEAGRDDGFRIELGAQTVADALMIAQQRT